MLFTAGDLTVRRVNDADLPAILQVYKQCEDFLSLGPVPTASLRMVKADLALSAAHNGVYCLIVDRSDNAVGVLDFVPSIRNGVAELSLLMISKLHLGKGTGTAVLQNLEAYLAKNHGITTLESGVQTNNTSAIRFWRSRGFQIGTQPISHNDGTVAYDMSKTIHRQPSV